MEIIFAALALFVLMKDGDKLDVGGLKSMATRLCLGRLHLQLRRRRYPPAPSSSKMKYVEEA